MFRVLQIKQVDLDGEEMTEAEFEGIVAPEIPKPPLSTTPVAVVPPTDPTPVIPPPPADGDEHEIEKMVLAQIKSTPADCKTTPVNIQGLAPETGKVNWSTHKNEGMRLSRFVESNAADFPHMAKMFEGSKKEWVTGSNSN